MAPAKPRPNIGLTISAEDPEEELGEAEDVPVLPDLELPVAELPDEAGVGWPVVKVPLPVEPALPVPEAPPTMTGLRVVATEGVPAGWVAATGWLVTTEG